jgi:integrase
MTAHPYQTLSPFKVRNLSKPGRYADGNGLYLMVEPSGAKRWLLRTMVQGRRRDIGLGGVRLVSLAEAREAARRLRAIARAGGDPLAERQARAAAPSFEAAARAVYQQNAPAWRNPKHSQQWINSLVEYAFPLIGSMPIDRVVAPDVLRVLSPIWLSKPETARRVRQRLSAVFDWAKAAGLRSGDNPVDGVAKGLPRQPERVRHHAALAYGDVPAFIRTLRASGVSEPVKLAFEFLILTATRTSEALGASWREFDLEARLWTIPGERMKAGRPHRVPLSPRVMELLARAKQLAGPSALVFPGRSLKRPMSNMVFLMTLRRMELDVTGHGFRSAFRDWASERTNFSRETCEMALAHTIKDKAEAAYRRGDLFEKRRALMQAWAGFAAAKGADIVPLRAG